MLTYASFPVTVNPDISGCVFVTSDLAEAVNVLNVLLGEYDAKLGRSDSIDRERWSVFVDGDLDTVAAAKHAAAEWIRGN